MATCDPNALMAAGGSCVVCLEAGTVQALQTQLLINILLALNPSADVSLNTLMASARCLPCQDPGALEILQTQLLCEISAIVT
jgi:hypothetical protein